MLSILIFGVSSYAALSLLDGSDSTSKKETGRQPASLSQENSSHRVEQDSSELNETQIKRQYEANSTSKTEVESQNSDLESRDSEIAGESETQELKPKREDGRNDLARYIGSLSTKNQNQKRSPSPKSKKRQDEKGADRSNLGGTHTLSNTGLDKDSETSETTASSQSTSEETNFSRPSSSSSQKYIYGTVPALEGKITTTAYVPGLNIFLQKAFASTCSAEVGLHEIKSDGTIVKEALATTSVDENARYTFTDISQLDLPNQFSFDYLLMLNSSGCGMTESLNRYLTSYNQDQKINYAENFVSFTRFLDNYAADRESWNLSDVSKLTNDLDGHNTTSRTYHDGLIADTSLTERFDYAFGTSYSSMEDVAPQVLYTSINEILNEKSNYTHSARVQHWDENYDIIIEWIWDNNAPVFGQDFNQTVGANEQGSRNLILRIGKNNGLGRVDTNFDYREFSYAIEVQDTFPVTSPNFELVTDFPGYFNNTTTNLEIDTGALQENCETFSSLALTETNTPPSSADFTISCNTAPTQSETYALQDTTEGNHDLYLWAIDSTSNISAPTSLSFELITTPPGQPIGSLQSPALTGTLPVTIDITSCQPQTWLAFTMNDTAAPAPTDPVWQTCTTSAYQELDLPAVESSHTARVWARDAAGNISTSPLAENITYDVTAPNINFSTDLTNTLRGGTSLTLNFSTSDLNGVQDFKLYYAEDGTTYSMVEDLSVASTGTTWTIPSDDTTGAKLKLVSSDQTVPSNTSEFESIDFEIDSTPPSYPAVALNSPEITSALAYSVTISDCTDREQAIVTNSNTTPSLSDPNWQTCTTAAGGITGSLPSGAADEDKTIYVYAQDSVGNISASTPLSLTYDTTQPSLNLTTAPSADLKGGESFLVEFDSSDTNGLSDFRLEYAADGTNFTTIQTLSETDTSHNWNIPTDDTTVAKLRLVSVDNAISANQTIVESGSFTIDSTPPSVPNVTLDSPSITSSLSHSVTLADCSDSSEAIVTNTNMTPSLTDSRWQTCSTAAGAITGTLPGTSADGIKDIYIFKKDSVGNISNSSGLSLTYDTTAPTLSSSTNLTGAYKGGNSISFNYSTFDTNSISDIFFMYAEDGVTFDEAQKVTLDPNQSSYTWTWPSDNTTNAKLKIVSRDTATTYNENSIELGPFEIDSTPPALPSPVLNSPSISSSLAVAVTLANCSDSSDAIITNSNTTPSLGDAGWQACSTTAGAITGSLPSASSDGPKTIYIFKKDSVGNISSSSSLSLIYDTTNPTVNLTTAPSADLKGGENFLVEFDSSDTNGLSDFRLEYAADGTNFTTIQTLSETDTSHNWNIPTDDTTVAKLRLVSVDNAISANQTIVESTAFTIDSTPPALPNVALNSPSITSSLSHSVTLSDCSDSSDAIVTNSSATPSLTDSRWQTCSTAAGAITGSLPDPSLDGVKNIYVFKKDSVGNISGPSSLTLTYDKSPPLLSLTTSPSSALRGGDNFNFDFSSSDENGLSEFKLEYAADGTTFTTVQNFTEADTSYTWSVPADNTTQAKVRLVSRDNAVTANESIEEGVTFTIDSTPPTAPGLTIESADPTSLSSINLTAVSCADRPQVLISESATAPSLTDAGWMACNETTGGLNYSFETPISEGSIALYFYAKDSVGNISASSTDSIIYDVTSPTLSSTTSLTGTYRGGDSITFNYDTTDTNGVNEAFFMYAADGTTFDEAQKIVLDPSLSSYTWNWPTDNTSTAKIKLVSRDVATSYNESTLELGPFEIDSTPSPVPSVSFHNPSNTPSITGQSSVEITTASCNDTSQVFVSKSATPPSSTEAGWQACSTALGAITYSFIAPIPETNHQLYIYSQDDHGNVSSATTLDVIYDITNPALSLSTVFDSLYKGGDTLDLNFSGSDTNGIKNIEILYSQDGTNFTSVATIAPGVTTYTWTIPSDDTGTGKIRLVASDNSMPANQMLYTSSVFEVDSTPPNLSIDTPANLSYHKSSVTIEGSCEDGLDIFYSGDILEDFSSVCNSGTYSQSLSFSSGDGNKTIVATQTDLAGNVTQISRSFIRDEQAPILARLSGSSPVFTNTNSYTWGGSCEDGYDIQVSGDVSNTLSCTSGSWEWTAPTQSVDGISEFSLTQTDSAGNTSEPLALTWTRDTVAPAFTINQSSPMVNNQTSINLDGSCEGNLTFTVSGSDSQVFSCNTGTWSYTSPSFSTDAIRDFIFTHRDQAGNETSQTFTWQKDSTVPDFFVTSSKNQVTKNDSVTFSGECSNEYNIIVSGDASATLTCTSSTWSWTPPTKSVDGKWLFTISQTNDIGNSVEQDVSWIRKTTPPKLISLSSPSQPISTSNYVPTTLQASSDHAEVNLTDICLKLGNTTAPPLASDCWVALTSSSIGVPNSPDVLVENYSTFISWDPGTYNIYSWVKDEAGNISTLQNSGAGSAGVDTYSITYDPGIPPELTGIIVANRDDPSDPIIPGEMSFSAGDDVYIKWTATDNRALPSNSISIEYTVDNQTWSTVSSGLSNSQNGGCSVDNISSTLDDSATGCFLWSGGAPVSSFFKIRILVEDDTNLTKIVNSQGLNSYPIQILAGNSSPGLGGSAKTAMFFSYTSDSQSAEANSFVMNSKGVAFFRDYRRGLLVVDPKDGEQKLLIPKTGSSTGDGGSVANATLREPAKITMDHQDRLLIMDYDRIRRINTLSNPMTIETIIGGGASTASTINNPLDLKIYGQNMTNRSHRQTPFFALPNGDIYFQSSHYGSQLGSGHHFRKYNAATGEVESIAVSGTGTNLRSDQDLNVSSIFTLGVQYDPSTSNIQKMISSARDTTNYDGCGGCGSFNMNLATYESEAPHPNNISGYTDLLSMKYTGMDGKIYLISINKATVYKWSEPDNSWIKILGSGPVGSCQDGTAALSCPMAVDSIFVNKSGKIFFADQGRIRTVNDANEVITIMGQSYSFGDGLRATSARFNQINTIGMWNDAGIKKIIALDRLEFRLREFPIGGNIDTIAGTGINGYPTLGVDAKTQPIASSSWFTRDNAIVDPLNGDIYRHRGNSGQRLNRETGYWESIFGGGATSMYDLSTDTGIDAFSLQSSSYSPLMYGLNDNYLIFGQHRYINADYGHKGMILFRYNRSTGTVERVAGNEGPSTGARFCPDSTLPTSCTLITSNSLRYNKWVWDSYDNTWLASGHGQSQIKALDKGVPIQHRVNLPRGTNSLAFHRTSSTDQGMAYYCSGGRLYQYDLNTNQETTLNWPLDNMQCAGYSLIYDPDKNALYFPFRQEGLSGVAEYKLN